MKVKVCQTHDIPRDDMRMFEVDGEPVLIANVGNAFFAVRDKCSHAEGALSEGVLNVAECTVECPLHGAVFSLRDGEALEFPAEEPIPAYVVSVDGDDVYVELPGA